MNALTELRRIQGTLLRKIETAQLEVDAINKTIEILERQNSKPDHRASGKEFSDMGLADSCRKIIGAELISPLEVRNRLVAGGYPIKSTKGKLLGSVYATVKRAERKGELEAQKEDGRWCFRKKSKER